MNVDADAIQAARGLIPPEFLDSPVMWLDHLTLVKIETVNPIRNFKGRGTAVFVAGLDAPTRLVTASAGNFGLGLAYNAGHHGHSVTVFAAEDAVPHKLAALRKLGADVRLVGRDLDEAKHAARAFAHAEGLRFVEDGREPEITVGAGTIATELRLDGFDAVVVPLGNGALAGGIGTWVRAVAADDVEVIAVCAAGAPVMKRAVEHGDLTAEPAVDTRADGIAVRVPVPEAVAVLRGVLDRVVLVSDEQMRAAALEVREELGLVGELAGVAGIAARRAHDLSGRVLTVLCGSNV